MPLEEIQERPQRKNLFLVAKGGEGFADRDGGNQRGDDLCDGGGVRGSQGVRIWKRGVQVRL